MAAIRDNDDGDDVDEDGRPDCTVIITTADLSTKTVFILMIIWSFADYWGGWACFFVSIFVIGLLTALIGDIAGSFGCTIGLKDAVTAISFVALGTSVPGSEA